MLEQLESQQLLTFECLRDLEFKRHYSLCAVGLRHSVGAT